MYQRFYILVLCLFLLGGCLAKKDDWQKTNTMSTEKNETHVGPKYATNSDEDLTFADGSGMQQVHDGDGSGFGTDDEDSDDEGSADNQKSNCEKLRDGLNTREMIGAYIPRCTATGDYAPRQCSDARGPCWCVDVQGREIEGSRTTGDAASLDCTGIGTISPLLQKVDGPGKNKAEPGKTDPPTFTTANEFEFDTSTKPLAEVDRSLTGTPPTPGKVQATDEPKFEAIMKHPGILAAIIGGAVVGLLCAILLVMFIVYRMRKKDEGSYALDEPKRTPPMHSYSKATNREFYA